MKNISNASYDDLWQLLDLRTAERDTAQARALKYEQALREIEQLAGDCPTSPVETAETVLATFRIARAALNNPMEGK